MSHAARRLAISVLLSAAAFHPLAAQEMWLGPAAGRSFSIELLRPSYRANGRNQSAVSGAAFVTGRLPVWEAARLIVELPVAHGSFAETTLYGYTSPGVTGTTIGNPYVGVEVGPRSTGWSSEVGLRVPVVSEPSSANDVAPLDVGQLADIGRMEAFAPRIWALSVFANYRHATADGFRFRVRAGPLMDVSTTSGAGRTADMWFAYGMQAGYEGPVIGVLAGFAGRTILTEDAGGVGERTLDQFVVSASVKVAGVQPGVSLRVPLDNMVNAEIGSVLGLTLTVPLP